MNDVTELTRHRAAYASATSAFIALDMKLMSAHAEVQRLERSKIAEQGKAEAARNAIHAIEFSEPASPTVEARVGVDWKRDGTTPAPSPMPPIALTNGGAGGHDPVRDTAEALGLAE